MPERGHQGISPLLLRTQRGKERHKQLPQVPIPPAKVPWRCAVSGASNTAAGIRMQRMQQALPAVSAADNPMKPQRFGQHCASLTSTKLSPAARQQPAPADQSRRLPPRKHHLCALPKAVLLRRHAAAGSCGAACGTASRGRRCCMCFSSTAAAAGAAAAGPSTGRILSARPGGASCCMAQVNVSTRFLSGCA
jgi:hypothetical protein